MHEGKGHLSRGMTLLGSFLVTLSGILKALLQVITLML